jgi:hypothetical protein
MKKEKEKKKKKEIKHEMGCHVIAHPAHLPAH